MSTVTKGKLIRKDVDNYDGTLATTRTDSSGGTTSGLKVGDTIDVLSVFGGGDTANMTLATMSLAKSTLGSQNCSLSFAPGTWNVTDNITFASNFTLVVPAGCVFAVSSGKTMTVQGVFFRQHGTYSSGSGTLTVSGTDILASADATNEYAADTGSADTYEIAPSPAISSYSNGHFFRFKASVTNTGASTLNVNSKGAKDIKTHAGGALTAGQIISGGIYAVSYDTTLGYFVLHDEALTDLVNDTTPQLGGALDGQGNDLNNLGVVFLTEQAAAEADVAGKGQFWVLTATPNVPKFTDDAGTDSSLARLDFAQEYTQTQNFNETALTSTSNAVAWAGPGNQVATHTLTENTTIGAVTGQVAGAFYSLKIVQHASSAKTVAYNAVFKFPGGTAPTMTTTLSGIDIMTFRSDGTNMYMVGLVQALS